MNVQGVVIEAYIRASQEAKQAANDDDDDFILDIGELDTSDLFLEIEETDDVLAFDVEGCEDLLNCFAPCKAIRHYCGNMVEMFDDVEAAVEVIASEIPDAKCVYNPESVIFWVYEIDPRDGQKIAIPYVSIVNI